MTVRTRERVPSRPFADWLNARLAYHEQRVWHEGGAVDAVLKEVGWTGDHAQRRLYRFRHRYMETHRGRNVKAGIRGHRATVLTDWYERPIVEDALYCAGVPFEALYPEIAAEEEVPVEPAVWCGTCLDFQSPINGVCPFCDRRVGLPTGARLMGRVVRSVRVAA